MPATYPVASDVTAFLSSIGVTLDGSFPLASYVASAIGQFEKETGYVPFIATTQTRYYDAPGAKPDAYGRGGGGTLLQLDNSLISVSSLTVGGQTKTLGTDFYKVDINKPSAWALRFTAPIFGLPQCITIVGTWGYASAVPDDAWEAIRQSAAGLAISALLEEKRATGLTSWKEDDVTEAYDPAKFLENASACERFASRVISSYRRMGSFF